MKKLMCIAALPLLLLVAACGTDDRTPVASDEASPSPVEASATATVTVSPEATYQPTATMSPESPTPPATPNCVDLAERQRERVAEWSDTAEFMSAILNAIPWELEGLPDDVPMDPEFDLLHGMDAPFDFTGDGPVTFSLTAENNYDETISFEMTGGPGYDFALFDISGEVVWLYSDHVEVKPGPSSLELEPDETRDLSATWDITGRNGARVEDGLYFLAGIIFREESHVEMREQFVYIGDRPSLEESLDVRLYAPSDVSCGEAVTLTLEVTNITGDTVHVLGSLDLDNYFVLSPGAGSERQEVWSWGTANAGPMPDIAEGGWIAPGEKATFTRRWELQDNSGDHVPPGTYELQASFRVALIDDGGYDKDDVEKTLWSNTVELTVVE